MAFRRTIRPRSATRPQPSRPAEEHLPEAGSGWLAEARATLRLAWPLIIAQLATIALTTTDVVMMGWLSPRDLAAGSLAVAVVYPLLMFGTGVATAASPLIAQARGAGRPRTLRRATRQGLWVALACSALLIPPLLFADRFLVLLGQGPAISALVGDYLGTACMMLPGALCFVVLRGFVAAHGETRMVLGITLFGLLVNALANYALMFGELGAPRLELVGAGISTSLVHTTMCLLLLGWALRARPYRRYALLGRFFRSDWGLFRRILALGVPIGLTMAAESGLFAGAAILMGWLGETPLAAHAIALQLAAIAFMTPLGLSHATTVRVGLRHGASDAQGVRRAGWTSVLLALAFMSATAAAFWFAPAPLVALFLPPSDPASAAPAALAISFLAVAALFQLFDGAQVTAAAALRGLGDTAAPMAIALVGYWLVGLPVAWLLAFPLGYGGVGIWSGLAVGLGFAAAVMSLRFALRTAPSRQSGG